MSRSGTRANSATAACSERNSLLLENLERHIVALLAVRADQLGRLLDRLGLVQRVVGEAAQPVRQEVAADRGERRDALDVAEEAAGAGRYRLALFEQAVH